MKHWIATAPLSFLAWLVTPGLGLLITWLAIGIFISSANSTAGNAFYLTVATLLLILMLIVATFLPPAKPWRETSALGARVSELSKLITGAALFGAAAVYGVYVSTAMSKMPEKDALAVETAGQFIWPIISLTLIIGSVFIGVRLGWDFYRATPENRQQALYKTLQKLNLQPAEHREKENFFLSWVAKLFTVSSSSGFFIFIGYISPVIVYFDVLFITEYIATSNRLNY